MGGMSEIALEGLIDSKVTRVIIVFLNNRNDLFHLKKISLVSKIPLTTTLAVTKRLVGLDIVEIVMVGKFKLYKLAKNKKTEMLERLLK